MTLINQPSMTPTRKINVGVGMGGGSVSGAIMAFTMFGVNRYYDGSPPADVLEVVPWFVWLVTIVCAYVGGYITREHGKE